MPRYNDILQTFQNGEISPRMYGRTDTDIYKRSARSIKNMIVYPQGGVSRRVGSEFITDELFEYIDETFTLTENARLIPFVVSSSESYVLIFSGEEVSTPGYSSAIYVNVSTGKLGSVFHTGNIILATDLGNAGPFADGEKLAQVQFAQTGDLLFMTHPECYPQVIARTGENSFQWFNYFEAATYLQSAKSSVSVFSTIAFRDPNADTSLLIKSSATTIGTGRTLTASSAFFSQLHIGTSIAFQDGGTVGIATITAYTSSTVVTASVVRALPAAAAVGSGISTWIEGAWSAYRGFPKAVSFWNGRVFFGDTEADPGTIWASQIYDLFEISNIAVLDPGTSLSDSDPQKFTIAADRANRVQWIVGSKSDLLVGTGGREYSIKDFLASSIDVNPQTGYGAEYVQPVVVDDVPVYVQRGYRKLREILYDDRTAGYLSPEVTFFAEHITRASQDIYADAVSPKIKQLAYQAMDNNVLWCIDNNGYLYAATKYREGSITAFHRHELGGVYSTGVPKILSIASVPSREGTTDDLFMIVKRTINSLTKITVEKFGSDFFESELGLDVDDRRRLPRFIDCAKIFRTHAGANFYARLYSTGTATEAGGSTTVTTTGSVTYTNKKANFPGSAYLSWDGTSNADFAQTGCIRFSAWLTESVSKQVLFTCSKAASDDDNLIEIALNTSGNIVLTIKDSVGTAIINAVDMGNIFGSGTNIIPAIIELNYSLTAGATRLFVNGKQLGSTISSTGTRDTSIDLIRVGADYAAANSIQDGYIADLVIFNSVQHTEDHEVFEYMKKATTVSRLEYLEGQTVQVLGDGNDLGDFVVSSGSITLDDSYDTLIVGLGYSSHIEFQPPEAGSGVGSAVGRPKRVDTLALRVQGTAQCSFGKDFDNQEEINFRAADAVVDEPIALYTGDKVLPIDTAYDYDTRVVLTADRPLPCNITCVVARGNTYD